MCAIDFERLCVSVLGVANCSSPQAAALHSRAGAQKRKLRAKKKGKEQESVDSCWLLIDLIISAMNNKLQVVELQKAQLEVTVEKG